MHPFLCSLVLLSILAGPTRGLAAEAPRDRMLVSPQWLKQHQADRNLVLLHVGDRAEYDAGHIAGARYMPLRMLSQPNSQLALELPSLAALDSIFRSLGITPKSQIVLYYGNDWVSPTTRLWFTLDYMGLGDRVVLLDGGMQAWKKAGLPLTADTLAPAVPGSVTLVSRPRPDVVTNVAWLSERIGQPDIVVIDARGPEFYRGLSATSDPRPGHLPGASNLYFHTVVGEDLRFKPDTALRRLFSEAGAKPGKQIVAYCHIGQQATAVLFAARLAGFSARLYDGSFQEWSARIDLAVEGAVPATQGRLITTEALAERLQRGDVTIIDARSDLAAYFSDHVPDAVFLHYENLRASADGVPASALPASNYAETLGRLGIRRDRPVVVYGSGDAANFNATFLIWILSGFRHPEVYLLDGGYTKWVAENRPTSRKYPKPEAGSYAVDPYALDIASRNEVRHASEHSEQMAIVDVRPADQFSGRAGPQLRRGHIPRAIHHFWQDDLTVVNGSKVWKPIEELRTSYTAQGLTPDKWIIIYCNTGTEASHAYFALKHLLGYPRVMVYVPGWTEWSEREELPIEAPQATP